MRILITGGTGFVGRHLIERLSKEHELALLALPHEKVAAEGVKVFRGNICVPGSLDEAAAWPEIVIHAAGLIRAFKGADFFKVNTEGTANLIEALKRTNPGLKKIVFYSSLMAGGKPFALDKPLREDDAPRPVGAYGRSKAEAEKLLAASGIPFTTLRLTSVYGAGSSEYLELFTFGKKGVVPRLGLGEKHFSLIHVKDVAEATARVAVDPKVDGRTFYVSDPRVYTWTGTCEVVAKIFGHPVRSFGVPGFLLFFVALFMELGALFTRKAPVLSIEKVGTLIHSWLVCDSAKFREAYPDFVFHDMPAGIREMYEDYRAKGLV